LPTNLIGDIKLAARAPIPPAPPLGSAGVVGGDLAGLCGLRGWITAAEHVEKQMSEPSMNFIVTNVNGLVELRKKGIGQKTPKALFEVNQCSEIQKLDLQFATSVLIEDVSCWNKVITTIRAMPRFSRMIQIRTDHKSVGSVLRLSMRGGIITCFARKAN
jgi:hypothetical protein